MITAIENQNAPPDFTALIHLQSGYKRTEVGVIPEDWDVKMLHEVLRRGHLGGNYPHQDAENGYPLIKMGNVGRGNFDVSTVEYIAEQAKAEPSHLLRHGDVLFNTRNTLDLVGKVAIWRTELPVAYYNSNLMKLDFNPDFIASNSYMNYALNSNSSITALRTLATGTTSVAAIYTRDLMQLPTIIPPKYDQYAIAEALSDVDSLLSALETLVAKKQAIKRAAMQQLLTSKTRLPGFSGQWMTKRIGDIAEVDPENLSSETHGEFTFNYISLEQVDAGILLGYSELMFRKAPSRARRILRHGDVLMSTVRPNLLAHLLYCEQIPNAVCSTGFAVLRAKRGLSDPAFLFAHLFGPFVTKQIDQTLVGSNYPAINSHDVESLQIPCPPEVREQSAISAVLSDMDSEIAALKRRRDKTRAIKSGMMQQLLTGRARLVETRTGP